MGIVVIFSALAVFGVTFLVGVVCFTLFWVGWSRGRGSWWIYFALAFFVGLSTAGLGALMFLLMPDSSGAPTAEQMEMIIGGVSCIAAAPGAGMTAGLLSLLKKRKNWGAQ